MNTMTTKDAARALRKASRLADLASRYRPNRTASDVCRLLGEALRAVEDAQLVLRNDACWRQRAEADVAAVRR